MPESVLNYIGYDSNALKSIKASKPKFSVAKAFDNSVLYRVYKKVPIKSIDILISDTDRTTEIKERYQRSIPIDQYIKENNEKFLELAENTTVESIQELEKMQDEFEKHIPYFIKYDKNYIWQIYYSKSEKRYFMLFPTKEGEKEVLFYMLKQKIQSSDKSIYVPICKEEYSEELLNNSKMKDMENYLWMFTSKWPQIYEFSDEKGNNEIFITGKIDIQQDFSTSYRMELKNSQEAEEKYTLLKALFIIMAETKNIYKFEPQINEKGNLVFFYDDKELSISNMKEFTTKETAKQQNKKYELMQLINMENEKLEKIKKIINEQSEIFANQEKQIAYFMNCRKSFFKKVKFFFTNNKKTFLNNKKTIAKIEKEVRETEKDETIDANTSSNESFDISNMFTISDLVKTTLEVKENNDKHKEILADINALRLKQKNLRHKIENAQVYLDDIEEHKKSWLGFWKYTNKDNENALVEGQEEEQQEKKISSFVLGEDFDEYASEIDAYQRKKLSKEECDAIFVAKHLLPGINSVITKSDTYILDEEYEQLKEAYSKDTSGVAIFGDYNEDSTKEKTINNKKFRENEKKLFAILQFNEYTNLDNFKEKMRNMGSLVNESYLKLTSQFNMNVYYSKRNKGFIMGDINPYKLLEDESLDKIYRMKASNENHIIFLSNIMYFDNANKTLPLGMDVSTDFITKVGDNKKVSDTVINIMIERDLFNIEVKKIKIIEEAKRI